MGLSVVFFFFNEVCVSLIQDMMCHNNHYKVTVQVLYGKNCLWHIYYILSLKSLY